MPAPDLAADNAQIAAVLREMAELLAAQGDNPYRVAAYRRAATNVAHAPRSLRELYVTEGLAGLDALPGVGPRIAAAIAEWLVTGRWQQLDRLRGSADPEALFRTIPGVGPELALRLHEELGVDTLEALETQARLGRLETLAGIGTRRAAAICAAVKDMLEARRRQPAARPRPHPAETANAAGTMARTITTITSGPLAPAPTAGTSNPQERADEPPVALLLEVDREYRAGAEAGKLPTIAPKRFNPEGRAWLPVLHTQRPGWHFTALYSNTERAHALDRVSDWVVIYAEDAAHHEHPYTVVTATRGSLLGQRVVRGREAECGVWPTPRLG